MYNWFKYNKEKAKLNNYPKLFLSIHVLMHLVYLIYNEISPDNKKGWNKYAYIVLWKLAECYFIATQDEDPYDCLHFSLYWLRLWYIVVLQI